MSLQPIVIGSIALVGPLLWRRLRRRIISLHATFTCRTIDFQAAVSSLLHGFTRRLIARGLLRSNYMGRLAFDSPRRFLYWTLDGPFDMGRRRWLDMRRFNARRFTCRCFARMLVSAGFGNFVYFRPSLGIVLFPSLIRPAIDRSIVARIHVVISAAGRANCGSNLSCRFGRATFNAVRAHHNFSAD